MSEGVHSSADRVRHPSLEGRSPSVSVVSAAATPATKRRSAGGNLIPSSKLTNETFLRLESWTKGGKKNTAAVSFDLDVAQEEIPARASTREASWRFPIFARQRNFIRRHKFCAAIAGVTVLVTVLLGAIGIILIILLPRRSNGLSSEETSPSSTTPQPAYPTGLVRSVVTEDFVFDTQLEPALESLVVDHRRPYTFIGYINETVVLLSKRQLNDVRPIHVKLGPGREECKRCSVYDIGESCAEGTGSCDYSSLIYCCERCSPSDQSSYCVVYGEVFFNDARLLNVHFAVANGEWRLQYTTISGSSSQGACDLQMSVVSSDRAKSGHDWSATGEPMPCFRDANEGNVSAKLLTAVGFSNESLTWRAYVDTKGSLFVSRFDGSSQFVIDRFVSKQAYKDSVLRSDYSLEDSSYLLCSFSGAQFSLARIQKDQLMVLDPLGFVYSTGGFGTVGGYFLDQTQLNVWYFREGPQRVVYVSTFGFNWDLPDV